MRIDINNEQLDIIKKKPITNARSKGNFGSCYIYEDKAFKHLDRLDGIFLELNIEKNLNDVKNIKVGGVALPIDLVYLNDSFIGYTMPYFNGSSLSRVLLEIKVGKRSINDDVMSKYFDSLFDKIKILTEYGIKVNDIKPDNIIVYNNELCLVDCDFYKRDLNLLKDDLLKHNIEEVKKGFSRVDIENKSVVYKRLVKRMI